MISKELREVLDYAGGKVIVGDGTVEGSFVAMKLGEYLKEKKFITREKREKKVPKEGLERGEEELTREELLDRINTDIAQLRTREAEQEVADAFSGEQKKKDQLDYDYL